VLFSLQTYPSGHLDVILVRYFAVKPGDRLMVVSPTLQESSVNRFILAACGIAAGIALSGCGAGQVSQTATQEPAVNGTLATVGPIALRNVHLRAAQSTDYVQPGSDAELLFVAANNSPDVNDKLLSVTTDIGTVSLSGDTSVPANGVLVVGEPDGQIAPLESAEKAEAVKAKVALSKPITNGLTYKLTFTFEKAGQTSVQVPISAGEQPRREAAAEAGDTGGHQ
jgi:copper(I)-binding protein